MSSPERKRSRSPARSRSPPARRSRSPVRSRSPPARRSPSPAVRSRSPRRSRSPVRSRSPPARRYSSSRSRSPPRSRGECDTLELTRDDAAFVVGRGGSCKFKIARASGAQLDFRERDLVVEIRGTATARRRAKKYIQLVMAQRVGPVYVDEAENDDDDLTMVEVPTDCIGYVTGKKGATMRKVEEEWGTLMFFVEGKNRDGKWSSGDSGKLAIFGERRGRRGTELKVMSAVEQKIPGHFTANVKDHVDDAEWGTDTIPIGEGDLSYALGKGGVTRKKLARASHCIMEYVGNVAFMSGSKDERQRARDYLGWLMAQRVGPVHVSRAEDRDDVLITKVPAECVAYVTGQGGRSLRSIEEQTGTFCFIDGERRGVDERLLIFGGLNADRRRAKSMVDDMVDLKLSRDRMHGPYRPRSRSRSPRRSRGGRSRSRSRSPRKSSSRKSRSHSRSASPKKRSPSPAVAEKKKASKSKSKSPSPVRAKRSRSKSKSKSKSRSPSPPAKQQKVEQKDSDEKKPETKQEPKSRSPSPSPKKGSQSPAH